MSNASTVETGVKTQLSGDGNWWWNGRRWHAAESEDGLWKWDGARWQPRIELVASRPVELAATLSEQADGRYAQAGAILVARADEWPAGEEVAALTARAVETDQRMRDQADQTEQGEGAQPAEAPRPSLAGMFGPGGAGAARTGRGRDAGSSELRTILVQVGRTAPRPTVKEADEVLAIARALDRRSTELSESAARVAEAEAALAAAVEAAEREVATAEAAREAAIAAARRTVEAAETEHARVVDEARSRLRRVRNPGPGELRSEFREFKLYANVLQLPDGAAPAAEATAQIDRSSAIWERHRELMTDMILLSTPGAQAFHEALTAGSDSLFLLAAGRVAAAVAPIEEPEREEARTFVEAVVENSDRAAHAQRERELRARMAEDELDAVMSDRSQVLAAERELQRVEDDEALMAPIWQARKQVEAARADTHELTRARDRLASLVTELTTPPAALVVEPPD